LEGVELANGRRGNLEIQQATDASFEAGGRGLNVRITNEDPEGEAERNNTGGPVITDVAGLLQLAPRPDMTGTDTDDDDDILVDESSLETSDVDEAV
jgi:hypothetical protein